MKENKWYKGLWFLAFVLVTTMFSAIMVFGDEEQFTNELPVDRVLKFPVSEVYDEGNETDTNGTDDYNESDGNESVTEEEDSVSIPRTVRRDGSSVSAVRESDGSITYRTYGTVLQHLGTDMIINWEKDTFGTFCWDYYNVSYCAAFGQGYGYNLVNVKVME